MAVAEASFNTSIDAISLALISFKEPFIKGNPSTTYNGSFPALIEPLPRILNVGDSPGRLLVTTETPVTRPCNACIGLLAVTEVISLDLTCITEPVKSLFF